MLNENGAIQPNATPETGQGVTPVDGVQKEGTPASTKPVVPKWMSQLPDELKGNETLAKHDSIGSAFKALLDGSKTKAEEPGADNQQEADLNYELSKSLSEDVDPTGVFHKNMESAVKGLKLPKEQAETVYKAFIDSYKKAESDLKTKGAEICESKLREAWGDKYDAKIQHMRRAYSHLVPKDSALEKGLKDTLAESNPFVVELLATIGESISEHDPPKSSAVGKVMQSGGFLTRENEKYPWG